MNPTKILYQIQNWRARVRAFFLGSVTFAKSKDGLIGYQGNLHATKISCMCHDPMSHFGLACPIGQAVNLGLVSSRLVTTAGANYMRDDFNAATGLADITNFNFHDSGTGVVAEAVGDTALGFQAGPTTRATGTQSSPATKQYRSVGTIAYTATLAITEHGLFSQSAQGGTLWDRSVFTAINVVNGDSIQYTYTLTISDGG